MCVSGARVCEVDTRFDVLSESCPLCTASLFTTASGESIDLGALRLRVISLLERSPAELQTTFDEETVIGSKLPLCV